MHAINFYLPNDLPFHTSARRQGKRSKGVLTWKLSFKWGQPCLTKDKWLWHTISNYAKCSLLKVGANRIRNKNDLLTGSYGYTPICIQAHSVILIKTIDHYWCCCSLENRQAWFFGHKRSFLLFQSSLCWPYRSNICRYVRWVSFYIYSNQALALNVSLNAKSLNPHTVF